MKLIIIAAVARNHVIGKDNQLIWKLADDMNFFKETTMGHPVITGRKNYESIPQKFRPLPGRQNIVITRNTDFKAEGAVVVHSLDKAIEYASSTGATTCFIIGGGQIYTEALQNNKVNEMYISAVEASPQGDTFFPEIQTGQWDIKPLGQFSASDKNQYGFSILHYIRK